MTVTSEVEKIREKIAEKYPQVLGFDDEKRRTFETMTDAMADEIIVFEEAAKNLADPAELEKALRGKNIKAIWIFSGPGTFYNEYAGPHQQLYREAEWTRWMDKKKILEGAKVFNILKSLGHDTYLYYNGTKEENDALRKAAEKGEIDVPADRLVIEDDDSITNTFTQIKHAPFIDKIAQKDGRILLLSNAPHISRILRMLKRLNKVPEGQSVLIMPLETPKEGIYEYMKMEIRGAAYYRFLSPEQMVDTEPVGYSILG